MQFWFLEAVTWSDAVICGCEQFEVVEVDDGDNFSHLERFYQKKGLHNYVRRSANVCNRRIIQKFS